MKRRRIHKKDEYIGVRMPRADKERFEDTAKRLRRTTSELVWVLACEGLERIEQNGNGHFTGAHQ